MANAKSAASMKDTIKKIFEENGSLIHDTFEMEFDVLLKEVKKTFPAMTEDKLETFLANNPIFD